MTAPEIALPPTRRGLEGLPMPRRPDLLTDPGLRARVTHPEGPRFPFPVPNGWFIVATSAELAPGDVVPLRYFGRDLVLFRGLDGAPRVLDAYCTHLGAHLAIGGQVEGSCIRCPFHGWKFDGASGQAVEVPYDNVEFIPRRANMRAFPTIERNHMIWAWHHLEGEEPFYDVPVVPEFEDAGWLPILTREFHVATCCQEMAENNVDRVHFKYVHGVEDVPEEEFVVDGVYKRAARADGSFTREGFGLGLGVLRKPGETVFLSSTTPVDEENVHVRWIFTAPRELGERGLEAIAEEFCSGVSQDIPIWENKIYKDPPILRPEEQDVSEHRRWCRQFYSVPAAAQSSPSDA